MPLMRNKGLLDDPVITDIAHRYDKTPAGNCLTLASCT